MHKSLYTVANRQLLKLLRELRKEANLTQRELAEIVGVDQSEVSNWERGEKRLDLIELCHIVDALELPLPDFIERFEILSERKVQTESTKD